jgi:hypothetical protein
MFFQEAAKWRFSRISVQKNLPDSILVFGRHFEISSNFLFFPKNMSIDDLAYFIEKKYFVRFKMASDVQKLQHGGSKSFFIFSHHLLFF